MIKNLWRLFRLGFWLGSTVFGGVVAAYPVIRNKAVEFGWLEEEEVAGLYAVAVVLPGPSFLNLWGALSARVAGIPGAVAGQVGLMLPSFLLVVGLTLVEHFPWVAVRLEPIMRTVAWATAGLFLATGVESLRKLKSRRELALAALVLLMLIVGLHPLLLLAASILLAALGPRMLQQKAGT